MTYKLTDARDIKRALAWLSKYWERPTHPEYFPARSIDEVVSLSEEFGKDACIMSGGIDIVGLMKNKVISPRALIGLKNVPGLKQISPNSGGVLIGSLNSINDLEISDVVRSRYPILHDTAASIGSPQIRNMGSLAGNLCQEVRCWYYRRSPATGIAFECRRKKETRQCYAANGENQYHAVMGGCQCFGVCPSDLAASLLALDARINTVNTGGGRSISVEGLYTPLGNSLQSGEVITGVQIPDVPADARQRFLKFRIRKAIDFSIVSVSAIIVLKKDSVSSARIVLGGVTWRPYRATLAEQLLQGNKVTEVLAGQVAAAAVSDLKPLSKNDYKVPILEALVKRSILE
jgi:xanthine dehydrogenase YagS FAD-binding subunit